MAARAGWLLNTGVLSILAAYGFARAYADPLLLSIPSLTELFVELNLGLRLMITLALVGPFVAVIFFSSVVFARRSDDPMALLLTATVIVFYAYGTRSFVVYEGVPILGSVLPLTFALSAVLLTLLLGLFPNGGFVPRWAVWLPPAMVVLVGLNPHMGTVFMSALDGETAFAARNSFIAFGYMSIWILGIVAQLVRYRYGSNSVDRQQVKWALAPTGLWISMIVLALTLSIAFPDATRLASLIILVSLPLNFLIPVALTIAVLKFRLYEIDRIISRTLGYAILVGFLGLIYSLGAVWLPSRLVSGSPLFVAGSTLAVAAAFNPLRHRVLRWVDKRFYRSRFDMERVAEEFSVRLRDQTDLQHLSHDFVTVVAETMRPSSLGLWIKPGVRSES